MGNVKFNYPLWVFDIFRRATTHSRYTLPLGRLVTSLLCTFNIEFSPASLSTKNVEVFSEVNLKKAGFTIVRHLNGEKHWVRKMATPPPNPEEPDHEETGEEPAHGLIADEAMIDPPFTDPLPTMGPSSSTSAS